MPTLLKKYHDRENGFTLIELLIVVLIIGVLAAIAIPVYLGIQQQAVQSAIKSDVNIEVKRVQVALTEGTSVASVIANQPAYEQTSSNAEQPNIKPSRTAGYGPNDFMISNSISTTASNGYPAGPINYSYTYDSVTGQFTESSSGQAFGSANPAVFITTGSIAAVQPGQAYSQTITATNTNPTSTNAWSATGLPTGFAIDPVSGTITATAATVNSTAVGTYPINVAVVNGAQNANRNYNLIVTSTPAFTTTSLPGADTSTPYSQTIVTTGSPSPSLTVTTGSLPAGLNMTTAGVISGTATTAGTVNFTVTATNAAGSVAQAFSIVVGTKPAISTASINSGAANVAYSQTISATGTPAPTFAATGLPSTLSINSSTGVISGTPTTGGTYTVVVTATNPIGTASQSYPLTVAAAPAAPTGAVYISKFSDEGSSRVSFHNYMWAGNAGSCASGSTLEYYFVDATGSNRGSTFWQTWQNFEIGNPYAIGTVNTWTVKTHCKDNTTGALSTEVVSPARSFTSLPSTTNLLSNASFENNNMNSWGVGSGSFTSGPSTTSGAVDGGTGSYIATGTTGSGGASLEQDLYGSVNSGKNYYGSIWVRSTAGTGGATICVWNITTSQNSCQSYSVGSNWTQITTSYTLTANSNQIRLETYLGGNTTYQFDDAVLRATN